MNAAEGARPKRKYVRKPAATASTSRGTTAPGQQQLSYAERQRAHMNALYADANRERDERISERERNAAEREQRRLAREDAASK